MAAIESPCVKLCTLDAQNGICVGCGRTTDQIARWTLMAAEERAAVMAALCARPQIAHADDRAMP